MRIIILMCLFFSVNIVLGQQVINKTYNTKINKADKVIIVNNKIDSAIVNRQNKNTEKMYLLDVKDLTDRHKSNNDVSEFTFGNPDSLPVYDIDISLEYSKPYDSAYFLSLSPPNSKFNPFDIKTDARDVYKTFSTDRKKISYKASYFSGRKYLKLIVFRQMDFNGSSITINGVGKLY